MEDWSAQERHTSITWAVLCIQKASSVFTPRFSVVASSGIRTQSVTGMLLSFYCSIWSYNACLPSSKLSAYHVQEARETILSFFDASPEEYAVVFTANATSALKLVGESYQFTGGSSFVLGADSHNSVHGIREYATYRGARVCYIPSTERGGFDVSTAKASHLYLIYAHHIFRRSNISIPRIFSSEIAPVLRSLLHPFLL